MRKSGYDKKMPRDFWNHLFNPITGFYTSKRDYYRNKSKRNENKK